MKKGPKSSPDPVRTGFPLVLTNIKTQEMGKEYVGSLRVAMMRVLHGDRVARGETELAVDAHMPLGKMVEELFGIQASHSANILERENGEIVVFGFTIEGIRQMLAATGLSAQITVEQPEEELIPVVDLFSVGPDEAYLEAYRLEEAA